MVGKTSRYLIINENQCIKSKHYYLKGISMMKSFVAIIFFAFSFQVLAASEAGTAIFKSREGGSKTTTQFEYLDESTARMNVQGGKNDSDSYMLFRDGKALMVANVQDQTMVMDMAEMANMASSLGVSPQQQTQGFTSSVQSMEPAGKSETVAGIKGELYKLKWTENGKAMEDDLVVTHDAKAVGYTRAWMTVVRSIQNAGAKQEVKGDHLVARLEKEDLGILRLGKRFELESLNTRRPDEAHFVVPAATMSMPDLGNLFGGNNAAGTAAASGSTTQEVTQDTDSEKSSGGLWGGLKDKFKKKSDRQANRQTSRTDHAVDRATDQAVDQAVGKSVGKLLDSIFK